MPQKRYSMHGVITVEQLVSAIITIGSLCTAIVAVYKLISLAGKPNKEQNARLEDLEKRVGTCEDKLGKDWTSMEEQQEINTLTLKSLHALLSHELDGNNTHEMEMCKSEIHNRIFREGGSIR